MLVSSANSIRNTLSDTVARSLICIKNSCGPNFELCGTPHTCTIFKVIDRASLNDTYELTTCHIMPKSNYFDVSEIKFVI